MDAIKLSSRAMQSLCDAHVERKRKRACVCVCLVDFYVVVDGLLYGIGRRSIKAKAYSVDHQLWCDIPTNWFSLK